MRISSVDRTRPGSSLSVFAAVATERRRQRDLYGEQNHEPEVWLAILVEEVGELATAMVHARFPQYQHRNSSDIRAEAVQVAAVAIALVECLDRRSGRDVADGNG